jgi:Choline-glycine betaine transporter
VVQLNYGLSVLFHIPDSLGAKAALIVLSVVIATISVTSGVDKGIRILSELNVVLALGLILFILFMGDTEFLLNALVLNVGDYVNRFMGMTLNSFAFDRPVEWMNNWTLFFWAWWVAWSPFVGFVPGAYFARAHYPSVRRRHADYSVHLYAAVAVGIR